MFWGATKPCKNVSSMPRQAEVQPPVKYICESGGVGDGLPEKHRANACGGVGLALSSPRRRHGRVALSQSLTIDAVERENGPPCFVYPRTPRGGRRGNGPPTEGRGNAAENAKRRKKQPVGLAFWGAFASAGA